MKIRCRVILSIVIVLVLVICSGEYKRGSNNQIGISDEDYGKSKYDNSEKDISKYRYLAIIKLDNFHIGAIISVKEGNLTYEFFNEFDPGLLDGFKSDVEKGKITQKAGRIDLERGVFETLIAPAESDDPLYILALEEHLSDYFGYFSKGGKSVVILADEGLRQSLLSIDRLDLETHRRKEFLFELTHLVAFTDYMRNH